MEQKAEIQKKEDEIKEAFVAKVKAKEAELKDAEREVANFFEIFLFKIFTTYYAKTVKVNNHR